MAESMPDHSNLCDVCSGIDIAAYFRDDNTGPSGPKAEDQENPDEKRVELGDRFEVRKKASQCALCFLVDAAVNSNTAIGYDSDATLSIRRSCIGNNGGLNAAKSEKVYCLQVVALRARFSTTFYSWIQLLEEDARALGFSTTLRSRRIPQDKFDMSLARNWINICQKDHGIMCSAPGARPEHRIPSPQPVDLLALDIENMCLCEMPHGSTFVALSYCWPAAPYLTHLKANSKELFSHGSLLRNMHKLPLTIQDAIKCTQELSFRYLWIDALCIIQDSDEHKAQQLRQMDRVYNAAELTVVAAYPVPKGVGDECKGLPGYGQFQISRQQICRTIQNLRLMIISEPAIEFLQKCRWDTRCWTYQEHHLSRRLLFFTQKQVYYSCSCNTFCEDLVSEDLQATAYVEPGIAVWSPKARYRKTNGNFYGEWNLTRAPLGGIISMLRSYEMALTQYTYRDVSFPSDILNAFLGISTVLGQAMNTDFWQGLPENVLDLALCFVLVGHHRRRRNKDGSLVPGNPPFPSWSWAGWESAVNLNDYLPTLRHRTELDWFIVNQSSQAVHLQIAHEHDLEITYSETGNKDVTPPDIDVRQFLPNIVPRFQIDANANEWREAKILACWTTSVSFLLDGTTQSLSAWGHERVWRQSTNLAIKDGNGKVTGCIALPHDFAEDCRAEPMKCEFILITRCLRDKRGAYADMTFFDRSTYTDRDWCTLNVMLITRIAGGMALRLGVGVIHEDAWVNANPAGTFVRLI